MDSENNYGRILILAWIILLQEFNFEHNPPLFAFSSMDLQVIADRSLTVTLRNSVKFLIILHKIWKMHPYHQDYLGFYTLDSHLFSSNVHGLLGKMTCAQILAEELYIDETLLWLFTLYCDYMIIH